MEIVKKHMITILCIVSIILLALPLAKVEVSVEIMGESAESSSTVTGFQALSTSIFAYVLIIGPALLVAMNYVKQLEKYKGLLAIIVPVVCVISLIIVVVSAKNFSASASSGVASAEAKVKIGIGAILAGISYIGTMVAGAVTFHDFTLDKAGLEKLKNSATGLMNSSQDKSAAGVESAPDGTPAPVKAVAKKSVNVGRIDEILALIEKLAGMKDAGILTEEEFTDKKKQLLGEIQ